MNKNEMKMIVNGKVVEGIFGNKDLYGNKVVPTDEDKKAFAAGDVLNVKYWYLKLTDEELHNLFEQDVKYFALACDLPAFNANLWDEEFVARLIDKAWFKNDGRDEFSKGILLSRIFRGYRFHNEENLKLFAEIYKKQMFMIEPELTDEDKYHKWEWFGLHDIEEWKDEAVTTYEQLDNWNKMKELGFC